MRRARNAVIACLAAGVVLAVAPVAQAGKRGADAKLQRQLDALVAADGGPPGAIVTLRRGSKTTVLRSGVADLETRRKPRSTDYMRIASVAKAFNGAVVFRLVSRGKIDLDDTIGSSGLGLPAAWSTATVRQLLNHTSGLPDYTQSDGFRQQFEDDPGGFVSPQKIISWVQNAGLVFPAGSRYEYSNTDNIVLGLLAQKVTGKSYGRLLREIVFKPLSLRRTSFPSSPPLPRPFIHGYVIGDTGPQDVSTLLSPSGAWASGAIVSTPRDLNTFIGGYLGARLFPAKLQRAQLRFVRGGESSPPGPGENSAGLAVFRYRTKCGTVYGHTGNFPGYVQFAAATRRGGRAVTTSLNIPAPEGALLVQLRAMQQTAVCSLLRD